MTTLSVKKRVEGKSLAELKMYVLWYCTKKHSIHNFKNEMDRFTYPEEGPPGRHHARRHPRPASLPGRASPPLRSGYPQSTHGNSGHVAHA